MGSCYLPIGVTPISLCAVWAMAEDDFRISHNER